MTIVDEAKLLADLPSEAFLDGSWRPATSGDTFTVVDPSTEEPLAEVADTDPGDALLALDAAQRAQGPWAASPPRQRSEILRKAYELMLERVDTLSLLVTLEMGKPLAESRNETIYAADFFRWFSEEAVRIGGEYRVQPNGSGRFLTIPQPVGPCLLITPWNFPLAMVTRKVGPALAAGCTVILKPAEATPLCALALASLLAEAGVPAGVVNVLPTSRPGELTEALVADRRLRKLSFTGSTEVGRLLLAQAAPNILRTSMELGGNAPFLVLEDADVDAAVAGAKVAKLRNAGESCVAANRFLLHERVAQEFTTKLTAEMAGVRVGRGTEDGVEIGPLIDEPSLAKVTGLVDGARADGAEVLLGGARHAGRGYFYDPTVVVGVDPASTLNNTEIFGPVAAIRTFASDEEVIAAANDSEFGLMSYVYTQSLDRALRAVEALESGMVGVNRGLLSDAAAPFGGVKLSGLGREGGHEGIEEYLELKYANIPL